MIHESFPFFNIGPILIGAEHLHGRGCNAPLRIRSAEKCLCGEKCSSCTSEEELVEIFLHHFHVWTRRVHSFIKFVIV